MARDLFNRYIWLVDTIRRYGRMTRAQIDDCWIRSEFSNGRPMPRRTFANYRQGAEEMFRIEIACDPATFEYYIEDGGPDSGVLDWLLNTAFTNDALTHSRDVADRIFLEDIPSARHYLAPVIDAMRQCRPVSFDYHPYTRSGATKDVVIEPYFVKLFRQRWYLIGRHRKQNRIKTYALDRMSSLRTLPESFTPDATFDAHEYARHSFGIVFDGGRVRNIELRVDPRRAKYLRALPLHQSQQEYAHDSMSIFRYRMRLTPDLVAELLSYGSSVVVEKPAELRAMIVESLRESIRAYGIDITDEKSHNTPS